MADLNTNWSDLQPGDTVVLKDGEEVICSSNWGKSFRIKGRQSTIPYAEAEGFYSHDQTMNHGFDFNDLNAYD